LLLVVFYLGTQKGTSFISFFPFVTLVQQKIHLYRYTLHHSVSQQQVTYLALIYFHLSLGHNHEFHNNLLGKDQPLLSPQLVFWHLEIQSYIPHLL